MSQPTVLREGEFDPKVKTYWLLSPCVAFALSVVLIPIIPIYFVIARFFVDKWLAALSCTLTTRNLEIKKGIFNKVESTIPLEKITDLQMYQGPVMRCLGLRGFRVETAGQSSAPGGHLVNIVGITDTQAFREAVLEQRDRLSEHRQADHAPSRPAEDTHRELVAIAAEIRDALTRIEHSLVRPTDGRDDR